MLTLGCHLSKSQGYLFMAKEAVSINANTFQYFTRNPRGGAVAAADPKDIEAYKTYATEHGIIKVCGYAPYDVEPANPSQDKKDFALMVMSEDIARLNEIPGQYYLIRPGSAPGISTDEAIQNVTDALNKTITPGQQTVVLVDMMPGEGTQVGSTFEQLAAIIKGVKHQDKVGICLDVSAAWSAGYDVKNNLDGVLDQFDSVIGLSKLYALHLNDSKEACGSHVNRHAHLGEGQIGFDAIAAIINNPRLQNKAFYLEEPHSTLVEYEHDIQRLRAAYKG